MRSELYRRRIQSVGESSQSLPASGTNRSNHRLLEVTIGYSPRKPSMCLLTVSRAPTVPRNNTSLSLNGSERSEYGIRRRSREIDSEHRRTDSRCRWYTCLHQCTGEPLSERCPYLLEKQRAFVRTDGDRRISRRSYRTRE